MSTIRRAIAAMELLLISPALFRTALFARNVQPEEYEPAHTAGQIVMWYAARGRLGLGVPFRAPFLVASGAWQTPPVIGA